MPKTKPIIGAHAIIYSRDADADRVFLRDVLDFPHVDGGHGWLIFALPPAEVAVHPVEGEERHELYLMCDDVGELTRTLRARGIECSAPHEQPWGVLTEITLPGGGKLGIYEPRHPRPPRSTPIRRKRPARRARASPPKRAVRRSRTGRKPRR